MKPISVCSLAIPLLLVTSCEKQQQDETKTDKPVVQMQEITLTATEKSLVSAGNSFALNLFPRVCENEEEAEKGQIFISPYSISEALTMTYNGAANATADSMSRVLGYEDMSKDDINAYCKTLRTTLLDLDPMVNLAIANSLWYREGFDVLESFINANTTYFDAAIRGLDFSDPSSKDVINGWIEDHTNGKIKDMIQEIDGVMFLVNAIWFKGQWTSKFETDQTITKNFYLADGSTIQTPFMRQEATFNYYGNDLFALAEFSYGQGNFAMQVILPAEGKTIADILPEFTPENWILWQSSLTGRALQVELPKMKFDYSTRLNQVLQNMGMGIVFSDAADFTGINPQGGLEISYVQHNSYLEVNEEGTEAAAATVVSIKYTVALGSATEKVIHFIVNKPFIFSIVEKSTGTILFMGRINVPVNN